ncbi:terpene cyclase/mutase family protein [Patescibacteria group bacterium]|nr:terpene cyclase/mutase family protein [Patescibacteria group bacterium]
MNKLTILVVFFGLAFAVSAQAADVSVSLRYQDTLLLDAVSFELPLPGTLTITDSEGEERAVDALSVLGVLFAIDEADTSFKLSKLQYFASFESLYLQCITLESEQCDNWLYAVNGITPFVGMDAFLLEGGEQVYIYFGPSHQVVLNKTVVEAGELFTASTQEYQYEDNTWTALLGVTAGVTQLNPEDSWSPIEIATSEVNEQGQAVFSINAPGQYSVGIKEDFYFPSVQLTVVTPTPTRQSGGGGLPQHVHRNLDVKKAIQFLAVSQNEDGSFGQGALFTDWAAIAFGAYGEENPTKEKIKNYLLLDFSPGDFLTDYERRAMALMSLSIDPYSGTKTDYIQKISDGFDGIQFGNPDLVNDDIFALLVLLNAGYEVSEDIIAKTITFILSYQQENGSFVGVDMTAAAVQVLALVSQEQGVSESLLNAKEYLALQQESSGGFKNIYSTSWAMQAMAALGEPETSFVKNRNTPGDYLYKEQAEDGGVAKEDTQNNRLWATAYAISGAMQKSWGDILQNFNRPAVLVLALQEKELKRIELEVLRIAKEVEVLRPQIAALHAAYLAKLEQPQPLAFVEQQSNETIILESEAVLFKQTDNGRFTAEAAVPAQNFFRSSAGQAVSALLVGIILFFALGGWRAILSLVRRERTAI